MSRRTITKSFASLMFAATILVSGSLTGCSEVGETTQVATATGGVVGAGLGALIGSQTGDAGGGLVIGALAGAGTGAAVGGAIESQESTLRTQDEAIERQEQIIRSQRGEIEELKRLSQDSIQFRGSDVRGNVGRSSAFRSPPKVLNRSGARASFGRITEREASSYAGTAFRSPKPVSENLSTGSLSETRPLAREKGYESSLKPSVELGQGDQPRGVLEGGAAAINQQPEEGYQLPNTSECISAAKEVEQAKQATATADRLFHYRRALRLCPESPSFHYGLGEVYLSLGRNEDAEFEFREALRIDPTYRPAVVQLGTLHTPTTTY